MGFRFAPQYIGDDLKRKRYSKACDECKRRKRKCVHTGSEEEEHHACDNFTASDTESTTENLATKNDRDTTNFSSDPASNVLATTPVADGSQLDVHLSSHDDGEATCNRSQSQLFVGDLNPEAALADHFSASPDNQGLASCRNDIGVWLGNDHGSVSQQEDHNPVDASNSIGQRISQEAHSALISGPSIHVKDQDALLEIFFSRINLVIPIVNETAFRRDYRAGEAWLCLIQTMCLVAAKDSRAVSHLRLNQNPTKLQPQKFTKALFGEITGMLSTSPWIDRITLIQIYALLSLHHEGSKGAEKASLHLMHAIHHATSLGLHLERKGNYSNNEPSKKLFWCLWSLDKLNACINGRPVMINERDIGVSRCESSTNKPFAIWIDLANMLSDVIAFYRPSAPASSTGWEHDFPSFESILTRFDGWDVDSDVLMTLHCLYHIVAILSSRTRANTTDYVSRPSFMRRNLAASYMVNLTSGHSLHDLLPLHIVPYGVSLALAVSYQNLRQCRFLYARDMATNDFKTCMGTLKRLSQDWCSAGGMLALATKVWNEIEKNSGVTLTARLPPLSRNVEENELHTLPSQQKEQQNQLLSQVPLSHAQPIDKTRRTVSLSADLDMFDSFIDLDNFFDAYLDPNDPGTFEEILSLNVLENVDEISPLQSRCLE